MSGRPLQMPIYPHKNTKNAAVTTKAASTTNTPRRLTTTRVRSQVNTSSDEPSSPLISVRTSPSLLTGVACDDEGQQNVVTDSGGGAASTFAGFSSPASRCRSSQVGGESFLQRGGRHHAGILRLMDGGKKRLSSLCEVADEGSDSSGRRGDTARGQRFDEGREEELQETLVKRKRPMAGVVEEAIDDVGLAHLQALHDHVVDIDSNVSCHSFKERRRRHRSINNNNYNSNNKKSSSYNNHAQAHKPNNRRSTESSEFPISSPSDIQPLCSGGGAGGGARGTGKYAHRPALLKNALPSNYFERGLALLAAQHKQMTIEEKLLTWTCSSDLSDVEDVNAFDEQFRKYEEDKRRELQHSKRKASKDTIDSVMAMLNKASDYDFAEFRAKLHAMITPHSKKLGKEHDVNMLLGSVRDGARSKDYGGGGCGGGGGSSSREKPSTSSAAAHLANQRRLQRKMRPLRDEEQRLFRRHSRTNKPHKPHSSTPPCSSSSDDDVACYPPLSAPPAQVTTAQVSPAQVSPAQLSPAQVPPPSHEGGVGIDAVDAANGGAKAPAACASQSKDLQSLSPSLLKPCSRLPRPYHDLDRRPPSQRLIQLRLDSNEESKRLLLSPEKKSALFKTPSSNPSPNYTLALHPPLPNTERQANEEIRRDLNQHHHNNKTNNNNNINNTLNNRRRSPRLRSSSGPLAQLQSRSQEIVPTQSPEYVLSTTASVATIYSGVLPFHHKQNEFCNYLGLTGMSTANAVACAVDELAGSQFARRSIRVRRQQHQEKLERTMGVDEQANDDTEEAEEAEEGFPESAEREYTPAGKPAEIKILCHIASNKATRKEDVERASKDCVKRITEPIRKQLMLQLRRCEAASLHCAAPADAHPAASNHNITCPHSAQIDDGGEESGVEAGGESAHEVREKGGHIEYGASKEIPPVPEHECSDQQHPHSPLRSEGCTRATEPPLVVGNSQALADNMREKFQAYLAESRRSKPSIYIVEAMTNESGVQVQRHSQRQPEGLDKKEPSMPPTLLSPPTKKKKMVTLKLSPMCAEPVKSPPPPPPPPPQPVTPQKTFVKKQMRKQVVASSAPPVQILRTMRSTHSLRRGRRRVQLTTLQTAPAVRLSKQVSHSLLLRRGKAKDTVAKLLTHQRQLQQQLNETTSLGAGGEKRTSNIVELCSRRRPAYKRGKSSRAKGEHKSNSTSTMHTCDEPRNTTTTSTGAKDDAESTRRKSTVRRQSVKVKARMAEPKPPTPPRRSCSPSRKTRQSSPSRKTHSSTPPPIPEDRVSLTSSRASAKRKSDRSGAATKAPDEMAQRLSGGSSSTVPDGASKRPRPPLLKTRATQSAFSCLRNGIRSVNEPANPMRNPLNGDQGTVLYIYYELDMLIVVQERMVSFWKCSRLLNALAPPNAPKQQTPPDGGECGRPTTPQPGEWQHLGECKRLSYDVEIPSPYANRICANNSVPVYLEMRCRELARERRDCNLLSVYINLYYFNDDDMHVKMHSVQLDAVQSLPKDVIYTTITESRYFVMAWPQENMLGKVHAGLCKYSLTPHLDTLASIREFKSMRREILSLECSDDDKLLGLGATELTIWDHRSGDVLMNYDLTMNLGRNVGSLFYPSQDFGQNHMLLLFQYANTAQNGAANEVKATIPATTSHTHQSQPPSRPSTPGGDSGGGAVLSVIACSISHSSPSHRILRRHQLPMPAFASIKQSMNTGDHLLVTGQNDEELWISCLDPTAMTLVPAQRTQRFYARGRNQLIELSERTLTVDSFANHVLKLAASAGKQLMT